MEAPTATRAARPRPHEELVAVVNGDRLLLASTPLLDLSGYSRAEAASPEFRAAYLFHPESSRAPLTSTRAAGPFEVTFAPPGVGLLRLRAFAHPIELPDAPNARALLFTREETLDPATVEARVTRVIIASLRSLIADQMRRLRAVDDGLAMLDDAGAHERSHAMAALLAPRAAYHVMDESIRAAERSLRQPPGLRGTYQRA